MSATAKLHSTAKLVQPEKPRAILGPGGNTLRPSEDSKQSKEFVMMTKKVQRMSPKKDVKKTGPEKGGLGLCEPDDLSVESLSSSDSSSASAKKSASARVKRRGPKPKPTSQVPAAVKRCHWITSHSDQPYIAFHDEEWGVPVQDDKKLFELLVFSQALAELSWPVILQKRDTFRKYFDGFDAASVAQFTDGKICSLEAFLSRPKVEAAVENAKQIIKVQQEYGSFSNYCWSFVNHKPIRNSIRYANQMPVKSPKALLISKDMMQRGFRCVGPTVVYSFMEVAGIVNDHLVSCFRYHQCTANIAENPTQVNKELIPEKADEMELTY